MKKIIGIVGMPASGKSLITSFLNQKDVKTIHLGEFIWNYLDKKGIIKTQETGNMASLFFWSQYKDIPIAQWAYKQIQESKENIFVLDGIRTVEELEYFRKKFKQNFQLIAIFVSPNLRKKRQITRKRFEDIYFEIRDKEELTIGVGEVMALSDYVIDGNKSKQAVKKQTEKIFKEIKRKKSL